MTLRKLMIGVAAGAILAAGTATADDAASDGRFALPREVVSAAAAFEAYMTRAAAIDARFRDGDAVGDSVRTAAAYEPVQLEEGMIGYGAIAALQDQRFVGGVERAAGQGEARQAFAEGLLRDPYSATRVEGAPEALHRVELALISRSAPLMNAGLEVKRAAYDVQHQSWSKVTVVDAQARLEQVKRLSHARADMSDDDSMRMMQALARIDAGETDEAPAGVSEVEAQALALAAMAVLGEANGDDQARLQRLLVEPASADCFRMSKLNLYQCMAVAGPQYEDIFCLGQHALLDTSQCVDHAAHAPGAVMAAIAPRPSPPNQSIYIPLAEHRSLRGDGD